MDPVDLDREIGPAAVRASTTLLNRSKKRTDEGTTSRARAGGSQAQGGRHAARGGVQPPDVLKELEARKATYRRWRAQYGGMKADDVKRLKELEVENARSEAEDRRQQAERSSGHEEQAGVVVSCRYGTPQRNGHVRPRAGGSDPGSPCSSAAAAPRLVCSALGPGRDHHASRAGAHRDRYWKSRIGADLAVPARDGPDPALLQPDQHLEHAAGPSAPIGADSAAVTGTLVNDVDAGLSSQSGP